MTTYDYNDLCDDIARALRDITGLRAHATIPDKVTTPCAVVAIADDGPRDTHAGQTTVNFKVLLLASKADTRSAQRTLNMYRSRGNAESIADKLEAAPGTADYIEWTGTEAPSKFETGGIEYVGCEFNFEAAVG